MRFTITRQNLHQTLTAVSASIPARTTLPVLSNILFEATSDGVRMSGTDLDVGVRVQVPADVEEGGRLTAPGEEAPGDRPGAPRRTGSGEYPR
jgi:DNA polymerase III subunit beta